MGWVYKLDIAWQLPRRTREDYMNQRDIRSTHRSCSERTYIVQPCGPRKIFPLVLWSTGRPDVETLDNTNTPPFRSHGHSTWLREKAFASCTFSWLSLQVWSLYQTSNTFQSCNLKESNQRPIAGRIGTSTARLNESTEDVFEVVK